MAGRPRKSVGEVWDVGEDAIAIHDAVLAAWEDVQAGVPVEDLVLRYGWILRALGDHLERAKALMRESGYRHLDDWDDAA